jgi:hypothetical protein
MVREHGTLIQEGVWMAYFWDIVNDALLHWHIA